MFRASAAIGLLALVLAGCQSLSDSGRSAGFSGSTDTSGTGRRVDVYGGSNAPVLPTMGMVGYGK